MHFFRLMHLAALVVFVTVASFMPALPVYADDSFYQPPEPLPAGQRGDPLRWRPWSAGPPTSRQLANAWQVMYRSTDGQGNANVVTGEVLVPRQGDPASMPIIALAPGTAGPAFRCAPSRMIGKGAFYEQAAINDMLARGYAVAVTDYEGYHPQPDTTYMIGQSMGAAVLDVVRAAQRLPEAGLSDSAPVIIRGYSQGGGAAMWAGQMYNLYAPDLDLKGIAGGGVPANLAQVALPLNGQAGFGVLFYALVGQDHAYPELSLAPFLNDQGRQAVADMESDMCVLELLQNFDGVSLADVTDVNPLTAQRLQRISENQLGQQPIPVPVYQYHEVEDGLVAYSQASDLRHQYCDEGVNVTWKSYDTHGKNGIVRHINLVYRGNDGVNQFIEKVLAGQPPASNCPAP
ncbi:lipase [Alcanivorax hongdengensis A-11-3]|uniref:Lipase n=1 Tax=Alcanivorax hongdengensis A-11-3 TaxID=1177179 RepID=L0WFS9_9GAMM|nr:lipase family protein [Alcanivorax hongdengensis]EKF74997.1 lipase [Alcanivorax hongdengensis A-11-3]